MKLLFSIVLTLWAVSWSAPDVRPDAKMLADTLPTTRVVRSSPSPVVWYLLAPPTAPGGRLDNRAPLSKWQVINAFDTEAVCRARADDMREDAMTDYSPGSAAQPRAQAIKCIVSYDPRLAGD
jgi:hypothetical protein